MIYRCKKCLMRLSSNRYETIYSWIYHHSLDWDREGSFESLSWQLRESHGDMNSDDYYEALE